MREQRFRETVNLLVPDGTSSSSKTWLGPQFFIDNSVSNELLILWVRKMTETEESVTVITQSWHSIYYILLHWGMDVCLIHQACGLMMAPVNLPTRPVSKGGNLGRNEREWWCVNNREILVVTCYLKDGGDRKEWIALFIKLKSFKSYMTTFKKSQVWDSNNYYPPFLPISMISLISVH